MSTDCRHGITACPSASSCTCSGPRAIPTKPGVFYRLWRWYSRNVHDRAERMAIMSRLVTLDDLTDSLRLAISESQAAMHDGHEGDAMARIKRYGARLDDVRNERLRLVAKLAALDN